jgi:UDP-N-acetyl-2-amino-2-deoxyglucuronate dehydrogenase
MYKVALVGCGRISGKHLEALAGADRLAGLEAVCDHNTSAAGARAEEFQQATNGAHPVAVYRDYRQMLKEVKPDVVAIATESGYHFPIARDVLNHGAHALVEKPLTLSTRESSELIELADRTERQLGVCFQNRFNAPIQRLKKALDGGRFGKILHGQIQVRWNRGDAYYQVAPWRGTWHLDGGTLMNQCTHGIDLLVWMMGSPVARVHGVTRRFQRPIEAEDFGGAILEFENGAVGMIEGTANVYPKNLNETLSVFGETGTAVIGGVAVNRIETWRLADADQHGDDEQSVIDPESSDPPTVYGFGHTALYRDFLESIDQRRQPLITGREGRRAVDVVLAIYKSMLTASPVDMPAEFDTREMEGLFGARA